mgnify:FL=1
MNSKPMHKLRSLIFTTIFILFFFLFDQSVNAIEIEFIQEIQDRGYIKVGIPPYRTPPFYYVDQNTNQLSGYDVEIAKDFASKLGVDVEFDRKSKSFNDLVRRTGANEIDLAIGKLGTTYKRMKNAHPHEYMNFRHAILSNRKSISALQGNTPNDKFAKVLLNSNIRIGFIANSAYSTYAAASFPNAVKKGYENWPKATEALLNGEIDGLYRDATEIKKIVYQKPSLSLEYVPVLIDDLVDQKSIYVSTKANMAIGSVLDYYLGKEIKIKSDTEIMNEFMSFYQPLK